MAIKKPKYTLDSLNSIMDGVAAPQALPQTRFLSLNSLWVAPQPRRLLGGAEADRLSNADDPYEAEENWLVTLGDFFETLQKASFEKGRPDFTVTFHELKQLAETIREHGLLQPILVRELDGGERYVITDGHRRALASILAGEQDIEAKIKKNWTPTEVLTEQLVANLQRKDFTALELTRAIVQLRALFEREFKAANSHQHPNALKAQIWDKLETTLGIGKRQLQRLAQLSDLPESVWEDASALPERRLRPLFKLPKEDQPYAIKLTATNDAPTSVVEDMVERRLSGWSFKKIATELGLKLPSATPKEVSRETDLNPNPTTKNNPKPGNNAEDDTEDTRINGVLPALKRLPRDPEPLFLRLEAELNTLNERERRQRLKQMTAIEVQAQNLARRLAEIRKRYKLD